MNDTGHGVEPEVIDRIFDPYFTTKGVGKGTGMGLSVVHGIVRSHDGTIKIKSEPGKGTGVEVLLPLIEAEAEPEAEGQAAFPTGTERILLVDDEPSLVITAERALRRLGYEVTAKTSSIEVLELFKSESDRFDLVITDMTMPHMTGVELSKEIMSIRPDIPIILCTGHSERIDEGRAKKMGLKAYAMKPLLVSDLAVTVRKVLDEK